MRGRRQNTNLGSLRLKPVMLPKLAMPRPSEDVPECPPGLSPAAQQEWQRLIVELTALGRLTKLERGSLAIYCGAYALWAEATEAIQRFGSMVNAPSGIPIQSPYVSIANRQADIMMRIAAEFGFTPASRKRTAVATLEDFPFP